MVKRLRVLWLCLLSTLSLTSLAAEFSASVDRKSISENDSFTLMLRYNEQVGFGSPDFSPLKQDFRILNQQRSIQFRSVNGQSEYFTEWTLVLSPQKTGTLTIPSISFDGSRTQAIDITVAPLSASVKQQLAKEFFFDIEVSDQPAYVQGQILYKEKLYYSVAHEDPSLSDFKVTDARVQPLGDVRSYQTIVDGQRLGVYERQYAIFPEESGVLVIPGQRFSARVPNPYDRWSRGRQASIVSKPIEIDVAPIPANYPQAPWLPSTRVHISEQFSNNDQRQWKVGEPVTRTIRLQAEGLAGSQIPAIALPVVDKLRYYPDQSQHSETINEQGLTGVLEQSMAIVPTTAGRLVLPEIRIPWWNTRLGSLEYAVLPARTITVAATAVRSAPEIPASNTTSANVASTNTADDSNGQTPPVAGVWTLIAAALLFTNLLTGYWLWRSKQAPTPESKENSSDTDNKQAFKQLKHACQKNDAAAIRSALIHWAAARYPAHRIQRLEQIKHLSGEPRLHAALDELDALLYSTGNNSAFDGNSLLIWMKALDKQTQKGNSIHDQGLKPLYDH